MNADVTARIGVHGTLVQGENGAPSQDDPYGTVDLMRELGQMGVYDTVIGKIGKTPPSQTAWLDANDLRCLHVNVGSWE